MKFSQLAGIWLLFSAGVRAASTDSLPAKIEFNRDIRPILAEACFRCHGPDAGKVKGGLRLDSAERATETLKSSHVAIVPGKPEQSELIRRITTADADDHMPPAETGRVLTEREIKLLGRWIEQGAAYQGHWAYLKPGQVAVPGVQAAGFIQNPIDNFIAVGLADHRLQPSPPADRRTLIRRLSFDLIGLPPTPSEVDAFMADSSPDAVEKLVDRLLASPRFGERLAVYWLDLVRYADTRGYHGDQHQEVARYRDYVINAFNDNKPFNKFTVEQLAGDLLPDATPDQVVASGYNELIKTTEEVGAQPGEYRAKYAADRVRNVSSVWLGSTVGCAECHDHKFDPFTARDYYRLAAYFADLKEDAIGGAKPVRVPSNKEAAEMRGLTDAMEPLKKIMATPTPELAAEQAQWERKRIDWTVLEPSKIKTRSGTEFETLDDQTLAAEVPSREADVYTVTVKTTLPGISAFLLEVQPSSHGASPSGRRANPDGFVLNEFEVTADGKPVEWRRAMASAEYSDWGVGRAIDGKDTTGWAVRDQGARPVYAVFETKKDLESGGEIKLVFTLRQNLGGAFTIGRFRLFATTARGQLAADSFRPLPPRIAKIAGMNSFRRTARQSASLADYYRSIAPSLEPTRRELAALQKKLDGIGRNLRPTLVSESVEPRQTRILHRGNWMDQKGEIVSPAPPAFLAPGPGPEKRATRLDLAKWLVSPDNPLVARVFVNRLWSLYFGQGIVKTLEDFGSQGSAPTHPELLDWLALKFQDTGGDIKQMVRLMVMSGTYRESSAESEAQRVADPLNQWLSHQRRFRLDAEMIRDNALAVSGLLVDELGGPSVKPYQPENYWSFLNFPPRQYDDDKGRGQYRRSVYTYWCRTFPHPSLIAFDAPTREECTVQRFRSNTPQQALILLNDPIYVEASRVFAERLMREGGDNVSSQIRLAFRQALGRAPSPEEEQTLTGLFEHHRTEYAADPKAVAGLLQIGNSPVPANADKAVLAAWMSVTRVILNLHETITRN